MFPPVVRLDRRVTIKQRATGQDAIGQPVDTWTTVATVWANKRYVSGLETIKGGADVSIVKASIRIRYITGIDAGMRIEDGTEVFDIEAVLLDRAAGRVDLVCKQVR